MPLPVNVTPEHLQTTSAGLSAEQFSCGAVITGVAAAMVPLPAALDHPSMRAAAAFSGYAKQIQEIWADGLLKMQDGADALGPAAVGYEAADTANGAVIQSHATNFD
ncbi:PE domain-containing protein [Nocardia sp. NPDC127579]|uniref:PE domain-containing protein n=1 Tax=Nocardia sp. NPDC127579 TaxID=3345402 RepID=UPI003638C74A